MFTIDDNAIEKLDILLEMLEAGRLDEFIKKDKFYQTLLEGRKTGSSRVKSLLNDLDRVQFLEHKLIDLETTVTTLTKSLSYLLSAQQTSQAYLGSAVDYNMQQLASRNGISI